MENEVDIPKLIIQNNWDIHKITYSIVTRVIKEFKRDSNLKKNKLQFYEQQFEKYALTSGKLHSVMSKMIVNNLKFHSHVAVSQYSYSVLPVLELGYREIKIQDYIVKDLHEIISEIKSRDVELGENNQNNQRNKTDLYAVMLVNAYTNIQQQKFDQSIKILNWLEEQPEFSNRNYEEHLFKKRSTEECEDGLKSVSEEEKQRFGFIESINTLKGLAYIYQNDNKMRQNIENLERVNEIIENFNDEFFKEMKARLHRHIHLYKTQLYFMEKKFKEAKEELKKLSDEEIEEALLIYFNNPNKDSLKNTETIYYNSFGEQFFSIFTELQDVDRYGKLPEEIKQKKEIFLQDGKEQYRYGRGVILLLQVIHSQLLRMNKKYKESVEQMRDMFKLCMKTSTQFSPTLSMFFQYQKLVPYLYEQLSKNKADTYVKSNSHHRTGLNEILIGKRKDDQNEYILKKETKEKNQERYSKDFCVINEIALQMLINHRNIQKMFDLYRDTDGLIVSVQKRQGENLDTLLSQEPVDQMQRFSYILQIFNAFNYLNSVNIIHSDLKLHNIVTVKDNKKQIKIIDFGFAQIKLFNRFFRTTGTTQKYAPTNPKLWTSQSDLHMIGKAIQELVTKKTDKDKMYADKFLISSQLVTLVESMVSEELTLNLANIIHEFKFQVFLFIIFSEIVNNGSPEQNNQEQFQEYINYMTYQYNLFISKNDNTNYFELFEEPAMSNITLQTFEKAVIKQKIETLIIQNEDFVDCLLDEDIFQFVMKEFSVDSSLLVKSKNDLIVKQHQQNKNSKMDILNEHQKDFIDEQIASEKQSDSDKEKSIAQVQDYYKLVINKIYDILDINQEGVTSNYKMPTTTEQRKYEGFNSSNSLVIQDINSFQGSFNISLINQSSSMVDSFYYQNLSENMKKSMEMRNHQNSQRQVEQQSAQSDSLQIHSYNIQTGSIYTNNESQNFQVNQFQVGYGDSQQYQSSNYQYQNTENNQNQLNSSSYQNGTVNTINQNTHDANQCRSSQMQQNVSSNINQADLTQENENLQGNSNNQHFQKPNDKPNKKE